MKLKFLMQNNPQGLIFVAIKVNTHAVDKNYLRQFFAWYKTFHIVGMSYANIYVCTKSQNVKLSHIQL